MEITLNSNEGISQAILRELKSEGVLTSNMDKEAWTNIFDEFKNDTESKINDTKVGEAWNDFYKKYNTEKNDKLTIAEATWNKIKEFAEAFKQRKGEKAENAESAQNTAESSVSEGAADAQKDVAQTAETPKTKNQVTRNKREAHLRSTNCKGVWYEPATGKHYREVGQNQPMVEIQPNDKDYVITEFNVGGGHWERSKKPRDNGYGDYDYMFYDKNGKFTKRVCKDSKTGKITFKWYTSKTDGNVREWYDENTGKMTEREYYAGNVQHFKVFNKDGSVNMEQSYSITTSNGKKYRNYYNGKREEIKE